MNNNSVYSKGYHTLLRNSLVAAGILYLLILIPYISGISFLTSIFIFNTDLGCFIALVSILILTLIVIIMMRLSVKYFVEDNVTESEVNIHENDN